MVLVDARGQLRLTLALSSQGRIHAGLCECLRRDLGTYFAQSIASPLLAVQYLHVIVVDSTCIRVLRERYNHVYNERA